MSPSVGVLFRVVLPQMTVQETGTAEGAAVDELEAAIDVRENHGPVKVDQMRVVRDRSLPGVDTMWIMTHGAGGVLFHDMLFVLGEAPVVQD